MATVTIKNIPNELYEQLKLRAKRNRRSINNEVIVCIEESVLPEKITPEERLDRVSKLHEQAGEYILGDIDSVEAAINWGRE